MIRAWRKNGDKIGPESIPGVKPLDGFSDTEQDDNDEVAIDFPVTNIGDNHIFDDDDVVLAKELLTANREQLIGTAMLYLAAAENGGEASFATIATAYMMAASLKPATE